MSKTRNGIMIILDGYGEGPVSEFNAVTNANTQYLNNIKVNKPNCLLYTDSKHVGLPAGTMGGSEVGHMTIGAGKIKRSMQVKIDDEIENGAFFNQPILAESFQKLKRENGALHIAGLWSDKQVHSNIQHCFALMKMAKDYKIDRVFIHPFTDGRDCAPRSCLEYFNQFDEMKKTLGIGEIATISGRFYIMDRENNLERTALAVDKMLQLSYDYSTVYDVVEKSYENNISDEFMLPVRIKTNKEYSMNANDLFVFFNTRGDRMKQPVKMTSEKFECPILTFCNFVDSPKVKYVYEEDFIKDTLTEYLSNNNKKIMKISESTKYAHVTYFFNGGKEDPFKNEDRIHIITQKTNDYALTPFMKAKEIKDTTINTLNDKKYDAIIVNFSNPDMVGHTGNYDATVTALEFLDECVKEIVESAQKNNYFVLICADHGNAESMRDENGNPQTAHTLNPVKCVIIDKDNDKIKLHDGGLCDVAPTFLKLMNIEPNPAFEGKSLF